MKREHHAKEKYKHSGIAWLGEIPEHWEILPIQAIFENRTEGNKDENIKFILSLVKDRGVIPYEEKGNIGNKAKDDLSQYKIVRKNDLVLNKMNAVIGSIGLSNYEGLVSPIYLVLKIRNQRMDLIKYFALMFGIKTFQESLSQYAYGIMKIRESIDYLDFKKTKIPLPPLEEQKAIAEYLDRKLALIQGFIAKKEKLISLLNEKKQSLINETVSKGLNPKANLKPSGIAWLGEIPEHWDVVRLGLACQAIGSGTTPKSNQLEYYKNGNVVWVNSGDLNDSVLMDSKKKITQKAFDDHSALKIFPRGSLVIAMYGATIGKVSVLGLDACVNQACCVLSKSTYADIKFLFYWFVGNREHIVNMGVGGGQPNISQDIIKDLKIPLPPLEEQKAIAEYLDTQIEKIDLAISKIKSQIELMSEYKTTLISEATCGRVEV